jgi:hypothetical protein
MNSDKVVVWYCLAGSDYDYNDGVNGYYIYNMGNVTYSGAGHRPYETTIGEAKLFVNTMIAAFRAAAVNPTMQFKDAAGEIRQSQFLPVEFNNGSNSAEDSAVGITRVYFSLNDPNLATNKKLSLQFYYKIGNATLTQEQSDALNKDGTIPSGFTSINATVYNVKTGEIVTSYSSGSLYYIELPSEVADAIAKNAANSSATLLGVIKTSIGTKSYYGNCTMTLQKLGYMSLR